MSNNNKESENEINSKNKESSIDPPTNLSVPIEIHDIVSEFITKLGTRLIDLQGKLRRSEQKRRQVQYST